MQPRFLKTGGVGQPVKIDDVNKLDWRLSGNAMLARGHRERAQVARRLSRQDVIDRVKKIGAVLESDEYTDFLRRAAGPSVGFGS